MQYTQKYLLTRTKKVNILYARRKKQLKQRQQVNFGNTTHNAHIKYNYPKPVCFF